MRLGFVKNVYPSVGYTLAMNRGPSVIGGPALRAATGAGGTGVKVGVVDDGVDPRHPFLDPAGMSFPAGFPKGTPGFTTPKVIVARAFFPENLDVGVEAAARRVDLVPRDVRRGRHRRRREHDRSRERAHDVRSELRRLPRSHHRAGRRRAARAHRQLPRVQPAGAARRLLQRQHARDHRRVRGGRRGRDGRHQLLGRRPAVRSGPRPDGAGREQRRRTRASCRSSPPATTAISSVSARSARPRRPRTPSAWQRRRTAMSSREALTLVAPAASARCRSSRRRERSLRRGSTPTSRSSTSARSTAQTVVPWAASSAVRRCRPGRSPAAIALGTRGGCSFEPKGRNASQAGAVGLHARRRSRRRPDGRAVRLRHPRRHDLRPRRRADPPGRRGLGRPRPLPRDRRRARRGRDDVGRACRRASRRPGSPRSTTS